MNNDELIAAGHELAKCLDSNTPLLDIAKLLSKMATQLGVTTAALREKTKQCEQVAAENAALKEAHPQPFGQQMMKALDAYEKYQDDVPETGMLDAFFILRDSIRVETPATDAFLREVRASAVDAVCLTISNSIVSCRQDEMIGLGEAVNIASDFAVELRKGGAA
ncbi:hypothetical protein [Cronobacter sakazakii]|uniref:hypothetical protein n=1 Tax=Cronobacter sakazakii TaxID=28141 RepID=UPI00137610DC|nr:hypothetical protein [Cronobacter sakazakii]NCH92240.1 hypothetical protein [Cronobacter sakazakii]